MVRLIEMPFVLGKYYFHRFVNLVVNAFIPPLYHRKHKNVITVEKEAAVVLHAVFPKDIRYCV